MEYRDELEIFRPYIGSDEYVLWRGKPGKGNMFAGQDVFMVLFGLVWLSFSLFWEATVIAGGAPIFFLLWGLPFIAIGVYLLFGTFIRRARLRGKTTYVITNKKIMIYSGKNMEMYEAEDLPPMHIKFHRNGNGSIRFYEQVYTRRGRMQSVFCALENLEDVAQAQNAIHRMEEESRSSD